MKRILSIALAALLVITMIPMTVFADTSKATDVVDVTGKTEITLGGVTYKVVTTAAEITDPAGNYYLANDITITEPMTAITGKFNGGGHNITLGEGVSTVFKSDLELGGADSIIANFTVKGADVTFNGTYKGILSENNAAGGLFYNITNTVNIIATTDRVGGLIGALSNLATSNITFEKCTNKGNITATGRSYIGGIMALVAGNDKNLTVTFTDCKNEGTIVATHYSGGIMGSNDTGKAKFVFTRCENIGAISGETAIGGIAGGTPAGAKECSFTFTSCKNSGVINAKAQATGGIFGGAYKTTSKVSIIANDCHNTANITGSAYACGGIIGGYHQATAGFYVEITNCTNTGKVKNKSYCAGGIFGGANNPAANSVVKISGCVNNGDVFAEHDFGAGGIMGYFNYPIGSSSVSIEDCSNSGGVKCNFGYSGGIFGGSHGAGDNPITVNVKNCSNSGKITTVNSSVYGVAGIVGGLSANKITASIDSCENTGEITTTGNRAAGIFTMNGRGQVTINNCTNKGVITTTGNIATAIANLNVNSTTSVSITKCYNTGTAEEIAVVTGKEKSHVYTVDDAYYVCVAHNHVTAGESNTVGACSVCEYQPDYMGFVQFNDTTKAVRFVMVVNNNLDVDYETFNMTVTINGKSITYASEDLDAFATVTADGVKYTAADGYLLFGAVVNMGEVAVESASVTITAGETVLYSGSI